MCHAPPPLTLHLTTLHLTTLHLLPWRTVQVWIPSWQSTGAPDTLTRSPT